MNNLDSMQAFIEQYRQEGGDMSALAAAYQAATAANKTPLGLNQWVLTDKPRMEEFNEDNRMIDKKLRQLEEQLVKQPEIYQLHLNDSVQKNFCAEYWITREGVVTVSYSLYPKDRQAQAFQHKTIAVLPEGFRPANRIQVPMTFTYGSTDTSGGHGYVHEDGRITAWTGNHLVTALFGNFSFVAAT